MITNINAKHTLHSTLPLTLSASPARAQEACEQGDVVVEPGHPEQQTTWILSKVKTKLATAGGVDDQAIDVQVEHGVVQLQGATNTQAEREEAIRLARATEGVDRVDARGLRVANELS